MTRCTDFKKCFVNGIPQPCAYGSGGSVYGGIIVRHGIFEIEWLSEKRVKVVYGKNKEFRTGGYVSIEGGYRVIRLDDGVIIKYPASGGVYAGG